MAVAVAGPPSLAGRPAGSSRAARDGRRRASPGRSLRRRASSSAVRHAGRYLSTPLPPPCALKKTVTIYTDGACSGNPGPGGWGAVLTYTDAAGRTVEKELCGAEPETTNNRMELTAAAEALEALGEPCAVALHSDSAYLVNAFNDRWLDGWQRRGWRKADKSPVLNRDLWERLLLQAKRHDVRWIKVKGHAGVPMNERVDGLAVAAMRQRMLKTA